MLLNFFSIRHCNQTKQGSKLLYMSTQASNGAQNDIETVWNGFDFFPQMPTW